ncbi:Fungalysin metallopeptidase-domain-containing protein [Lanmaoa asiatica]|nr:Fungalysin metallopeptidase-domain-containing protein [Lanmaoa asiatica]
MHGLTVTFTLAGLAAHALAHLVPPQVPPSTTPIRRKTLGFGPDLPHTRFESAESDVHVSATAVDITKDAYAVAREFLSQYDDFQVARAYVIRPDSYTDHATGVTHVYARQIIGGIEVANAHINMNIKDGRLLSFGDSFFPGELDHHSRVPVHPHGHHCAQLSSALDVHRSLLQSPLASCDRARIAHTLANIKHLHVSNCANVPSFSSLADSGEVDLDPRRPLLAFLASALPENHPEFSSLGNDLEEHVSNILITPEMHLLGEHPHIGISLSNVPGAVSEVKARIVWVQVPTEHGVKLELVHRFEVEMEYNWYETTVTTSIPHRIVSVVDWVSDFPMPMPIFEADQLPNLGAFVPPGSKGAPQPPELNKASYLVFPWGTNDPVDAAQRKAAEHGESAGAEYPLSYGREVVEDLGDAFASPAGWHTLPFSHDPSVSEEDKTAFGDSYWRTTNTTWGNNVFAHENWEGKNAWMYNERPSLDETFSYPYSPKPAHTAFELLDQAKTHIKASVTQLFYTSNMVHDLFYRYGFTEAAGNFQQYNFKRGGEEGDAVIADAQDGGGFNNAMFASPPDGQNGRCRMLLWDTDSPYPDGVMEADIVIHELSHGLSVRLTGGPKNSGCLGWGESGGMGEGWGDLIAITIRSTSTYSDYPVGAWAANLENGVRHYPYSTEFSVNPSTYETLDKPEFFGLHALGEVWAEMLWVIQQRLIAKHGFSDTLLPPVPNTDGTLPPNDFYRPQTLNRRTGSPNPLVPKHGNTLLLQLVVNGMKMQPCSPSFFDARAAIIEADKVLTGGENVCDIWKGFAERGLGVDAKLSGSTLPGGGVRTNVSYFTEWKTVGVKLTCAAYQGFKVPAECRSGELQVMPEPTSELTSGPNECEPSSFWYPFNKRVGEWILRLPWGHNNYYH